MSRHKNLDSPEEDELFRREMSDVRPIDRPRSAGPPAKRRHKAATSIPVVPIHFEIETYGERIEAVAPGVDRAVAFRLSQGGVPFDLRLDLHLKTKEEARRSVRRALLRAVSEGRCCVLVIHGKGRRSDEGPVLKEALPGWLGEPPHGDRIEAFASAPPNLGGSGATLVLLRQK